MTYASSHEFFERELDVFKESLEELAGRRITEQALKKAIEAHNENRALLRELYELRKANPPLLSGVEATEIVVTGTSIPVVEHNALLRDVLKQLEHRKEKPEGKRARIMIYGCEIDNTQFVQLVEESGAYVVVDDICMGTKGFYHDVTLADGLYEGIANHYIANSRCPRFYWSKTGTHKDDLDNRFRYILDYAKDFKVDGVISYVIRYCDTFEFDVPDVRDYLQESGIPFLHIEDEYAMSGAARLRTRCQAFVEMIGKKEL